MVGRMCSKWEIENNNLVWLKPGKKNEPTKKFPQCWAVKQNNDRKVVADRHSERNKLNYT